MKVTKTKLDGVLIIEPDVFGDHRGFFMESYNRTKFKDIGADLNLIQDNHSLSGDAGTIRGLHYQLNPKAQTKVVRALTGALYDVVVDIRKNSPTFAEWIGVILSEDNKRQLIVPKGFAHGICTLVKNTQILYKVDEFYSPEQDRGILWNDPLLGITWPTSTPILSVKDQSQPLLEDAEINFEYKEGQ
ncbi:dTDP-4-dehydrorhamnose 3,5-epimerase [Peribacillus cavernae]|uniref:dTDP-4-dehydrorhamnose 3,5-epimerase n=1 Tax=Peribacillus cavernae TaxID=1674310 RepID=A0A433HLV9_9BACI|nr:dTDP-4-dehydrorhamnose 3,5-epimerase [Peribacillus cavernae]MDQ0218898.1 dTDP-4-dehydrorhamnose 3,5-epimerase [Peribacillus cavernae]RUQ29381.1 dTDP-4-dehydrorhamnose 3,5-epimerase [Peribacillus cavernae]